ncbi:MAG: MATE family efflux transporter [Oscillospiraceae bacterium]|nr:MATE family efflux transporter [Oscillospiraceae bacterium]
MASKSYEIDMCSGPLLPKILRFSLPLMLSGMLQLLFNAADMVVVGRFSGSEALAAVGSTGSLVNLLINVFMGLSIGTNVLVARFYGARDAGNVSETVHTSVLLSLVCGVFLIFVGFFVAPPLLELMGTPEDVLSQAVLYIRIYFAGMPVIMLYNFGSAVLRALGDTRRPLYFLVIAGVANVLMNLFFVIVLKMGVAGVALATVLAQAISAGLVTLCLIRSDGIYRLQLKKLKIHKEKLLAMMQIGLPAGLQGAIFSISNVLIQSSINSFGSVAMAGNTASSNIEGFVYTAMNSLYQANLSFTSQNMGAKKYSRINRIALICVGIVTVVGLVLGVGATLVGRSLLGIYSSDPAVIEYGIARMRIIATLYFLCGIMDCMVGSMRGLGYSILPMIVSLTGACGLRILWILTVFAAHRSLFVLYLSYPVSWTITALAHVVCFLIVRRRIPKTDGA